MRETSGNIAIFDLDYTITRKGTWSRFVLRTIKDRPSLWLPVLLSMAKNQFFYKIGTATRCGVKQAMMNLSMVGWTKEKVEDFATSFSINEVQTGLRPGAVKAIEAHRAAGDTLIIASAAVDVIVAQMSKQLGIDHYVATEMDWNDGCLSAEFASKNCYGAEKLARVQDYLDRNPRLKQNHTKITMYSDSHSDLDLLLWADEGIGVDPTRQLKALSRIHELKVVSWL